MYVCRDNSVYIYTYQDNPYELELVLCMYVCMYAYIYIYTMTYRRTHKVEHACTHKHTHFSIHMIFINHVYTICYKLAPYKYKNNTLLMSRLWIHACMYAYLCIYMYICINTHA